MTLEWSHGRRRPVARDAHGDVPSLPPAEESAPERDPSNGRFLPANRAARRRTLKRVVKGLHTLNPTAVATWLRPYAELSATYALELAGTMPEHPALLALAGDAADARAVARGLLALAAQGDADALAEARAWLREHRAIVATLAALSKELVAADADRAASAPLDLGGDP